MSTFPTSAAHLERRDCSARSLQFRGPAVSASSAAQNPRHADALRSAVKALARVAITSRRLAGRWPPVETFKLDAEIDATDRQLEGGSPDLNRLRSAMGSRPISPRSETLTGSDQRMLQANFNLSQQGVLEIMPMLSPFVLFVWSANRIAPVRITELSITEDAFDPTLNPIRAKVSLGLRVLTIDDLTFSDKGGSLYMAYQRQKAKHSPALSVRHAGGTLGISKGSHEQRHTERSSAGAAGADVSLEHYSSPAALTAAITCHQHDDARAPGARTPSCATSCADFLLPAGSVRQLLQGAHRRPG